MDLTKEAILSILNKHGYPYHGRNWEQAAAELATSIANSDTVLDRQKELYKLEYEKAADRYQSIYASIWTNFSYMSVVAGALLTFGGNVFSNVLLVAFLASLPLIFWYLVSFIPMNSYGNDAIHRLHEIEIMFYDLFGVEMGHFGKFNTRRTANDKTSPRVRPAMLVFGFALIVFSIFSGLYYVYSSFSIEPANLTDTKQLAKRIIPEPGCDTSTISGINKILLDKLSASAQKSLCEFRDSSQESAPDELKSHLTRAFNSVIQGGSLCVSLQDECIRQFDGKYSFYIPMPGGQALLNRKFLENVYTGSLPSYPVWRTCLFLCMMFLVYVLIFIRVGREALEIRSEMKEQWTRENDGINLVTTNAISQELTSIQTFLRKNNPRLRVRIRVVANVDSVLWDAAEDKESRLTGFAEQNGGIALAHLSKPKLDEASPDVPS